MTCAFCNKENNIGDRIIASNDLWYAFVPGDPEIFGHVLVTYSDEGKNCIHGIWEEPEKTNGDTDNEEQYKKIRESMLEGVKIVSKKLIKIDNVDRIYVAMLGETPTVHIHFHLFPRYGFLNDREIAKWAETYGLSKGKIEWRKFYANPTLNFEFHDGFVYLGEIERTYNNMRKLVDSPPAELVDEMAEKLRQCIE